MRLKFSIGSVAVLVLLLVPAAALADPTDGPPVGGFPALPQFEGCPYVSLESSAEPGSRELLNIQRDVLADLKGANACGQSSGGYPTGPVPAPDIRCVHWQRSVEAEYQLASSGPLGAQGTAYGACYPTGSQGTANPTCLAERKKSRTKEVRDYCLDKVVGNANDLAQQLNRELKTLLQNLSRTECKTSEAVKAGVRGLASMVTILSPVVGGSIATALATYGVAEKLADLKKILDHQGAIKGLEIHEKFRLQACLLFVANKFDVIYGCPRPLASPLDAQKKISFDHLTKMVKKSHEMKLREELKFYERTFDEVYKNQGSWSEQAQLEKAVESWEAIDQARKGLTGNESQCLTEVVVTKPPRKRCSLKNKDGKNSASFIRQGDDCPQSGEEVAEGTEGAPEPEGGQVLDLPVSEKNKEGLLRNTLQLLADMCLVSPHVWLREPKNDYLASRCRNFLSCLPEAPRLESGVPQGVGCDALNRKEKYVSALIGAISGTPGARPDSSVKLEFADNMAKYFPDGRRPEACSHDRVMSALNP